jgi:hypothetical protein
LSTLSSVILKDVIANLPAAAIPGRLFFATDTHVALRDNGSSWDSVVTANALTLQGVAVSATAPSSGQVLEFNGSDWVPATVAASTAILGVIAVAPASGGNFTVAHGLAATPSAALVMMTSDGGIWFQSPTMFDGTNLYLTASDAGITGSVVCF